jgi:hypothetical protein
MSFLVCLVLAMVAFAAFGAPFEGLTVLVIALVLLRYL